VWSRLPPLPDRPGEVYVNVIISSGRLQHVFARVLFALVKHYKCSFLSPLFIIICVNIFFASYLQLFDIFLSVDYLLMITICSLDRVFKLKLCFDNIFYLLFNCRSYIPVRVCVSFMVVLFKMFLTILCVFVCPGRLWLPDCRSVHPLYSITPEAAVWLVRETCFGCSSGAFCAHCCPVVPVCQWHRPQVSPCAVT